MQYGCVVPARFLARPNRLIRATILSRFPMI